MSTSTGPQDRTAKLPSPTDSEKAQESYDEFLRILSEFQTVLRKAIQESQIEEPKKSLLCGDIQTIIIKANRELGTGTAFKSMDEKRRQELVNWLLAAYNHSASVASEVLEETTEKLRTEEARLKKELERNTEEWKRTQADVREERKRTIESGIDQMLRSQGQGVFVRNAEEFVDMLGMIEEMGYAIQDIFRVTES